MLFNAEINEVSSMQKIGK